VDALECKVDKKMSTLYYQHVIESTQSYCLLAKTLLQLRFEEVFAIHCNGELGLRALRASIRKERRRTQ
jgi:hypothetical protein